MTLLPRHRGNASSAPQCLLGDRRKLKEGDKDLSPSLFKGISYENPRTLQLIVIRKELLTLTGEPWTAAILGQFMYWSQQVTDFKPFIEEEMRVFSKNRSSCLYGWFHKTTQEFMKETKLYVGIMAFHRYLSFLVDKGWIQTRMSSQDRWDRTVQYRVNLRKLCVDLQENGYSLPGFIAYGILHASQQESFEKSKRSKINSDPSFASEVKNSFSKRRRK
ncbi:MAG: hypothetical protein KBD90_03255 [Alphaproteobacteria bacterium]|nr:hypothetical protein [Alphaproteobacteria bacterium]